MGGPNEKRHNVLFREMPPQLGPKRVELSDTAAAAVDGGSVVVGLGTAAVNFLLTASLNSLWSMINTQ